jgi:aspartate ammonia-lyase
VFVYSARSACKEFGHVEVNEQHVFESMAVATALVPTLGYAKVSEFSRQSVHEGQPLIKILEESGVLSATEARRHIEESTHPTL